MSKLEKLLQKLQSKPSPKDFAWKDLQTLMASLGYKEVQGKGSRVKFINKALLASRLIMLHKRHPDPTLLKYQIEYVLEELKKAKLR